MAGTSTTQGEGSTGELLSQSPFDSADRISDRTPNVLERLAKENTFE